LGARASRPPFFFPLSFFSRYRSFEEMRGETPALGGRPLIAESRVSQYKVRLAGEWRRVALDALKFTAGSAFQELT
jgi:hypothetical protein